MVSQINTTDKAEREAKLDRALKALKAAVIEYDPTILSLGVMYAGDHLDRLDAIVFSRRENFTRPTAYSVEEGGAA